MKATPRSTTKQAHSACSEEDQLVGCVNAAFIRTLDGFGVAGVLLLLEPVKKELKSSQFVSDFFAGAFDDDDDGCSNAP